MKIEELRVGNYVRVKYYAYDELDTHNEITGITEEHPFVNGIVFDYLEYDEIEPIPLTEEWLLKFGFRKDGREYLIKEHEDCNILLFHSEIHQVFYPFCDVERRQYLSTKRVEYLHQLQNLYFVLTGQELCEAR